MRYNHNNTILKIIYLLRNAAMGNLGYRYYFLIL